MPFAQIARPSGLKIALAFMSGLVSVGAWADLADYPFRVVAEEAVDGHRIVAINDGPAPVSVRIEISGENLGTDRNGPLRSVVPPRTRLAVARTFPFDPRRPYRVTPQTNFRVGDERSSPDAAAFRLPFAEGQGAVVARTDHRHAASFNVPAGASVLAARSGRVIDLDAHGVILLHTDGSYARYFQITPAVELRLGQQMAVAAPLGVSRGDAVEFAVQHTVANAEGPRPVATPVTFFAYTPPQPLTLRAGETVVADYSHAYVAPPPLPPKAKPAEVRPTVTVVKVADLDRETVQRAYVVQSGSRQAMFPRLQRPSAFTVAGAVAAWQTGASMITGVWDAAQTTATSAGQRVVAAAAAAWRPVASAVATWQPVEWVAAAWQPVIAATAAAWQSMVSVAAKTWGVAATTAATVPEFLRNPPQPEPGLVAAGLVMLLLVAFALGWATLRRVNPVAAMT